MSGWETFGWVILGGAVIMFMLPRIKQQSKTTTNAPKDWAGVLIPIAIVIVFVILLVQMV